MAGLARERVLVCSDKSFGRDLSFTPGFLNLFEVQVCGSSEELLDLAGDLEEPMWIFFTFWSDYIPSTIYLNHRAVVFHMTDLPFGRGGTPLQNLIKLGLKRTKLSAIQCSQEIDAGPIFLKTDLSLDGSAAEIFWRAEKLFPEMIESIVLDDIRPMQQEGEIVRFSRRSPDMSRLDSDEELEGIFDSIRMVDAECYPRAFIVWGDYRVEFSEAQLNGDEIRGTFVLKKERAE